MTFVKWTLLAKNNRMLGIRTEYYSFEHKYETRAVRHFYDDLTSSDSGILLKENDSQGGAESSHGIYVEELKRRGYEILEDGWSTADSF